MKTKLANLKYGDHFTLLQGSTIVYQVISGSKGREMGIKVKGQTGAVGKLSGTRYIYKKENNNG